MMMIDPLSLSEHYGWPVAAVVAYGLAALGGMIYESFRPEPRSENSDSVAGASSDMPAHGDQVNPELRDEVTK